MWKSTVIVLSSMSTAVLLLLLLALVSACGTMLEQNLTAGQYEEVLGTFWFSVFDFFSLFSLYNAPWFLVCLFLLMFSVVSCLFRNGPALWRSLRIKKIPPQIILDEMPFSTSVSKEKNSSVCKLLTESSFRTKDGVKYTSGFLYRYGYFSAHVGVVLVALYGLISGVVGYKYYMDLEDGQSAGSAYSFERGEVRFHKLPFQIKNEGFVIDFYENGGPKKFTSDVVIVDGDKEHEGVVEVNKPLRYGNYLLYQTSFGDSGSDVILNIKDLSDFSNASIKYKFSHRNPLEREGYILEVEAVNPATIRQVRKEGGQPLQTVNDGPTVDYSIDSPAREKLLLRAYQDHPDIIGLSDGSGGFVPVFIGLEPDDNDAWSVLAKYRESKKKLKTQGESDAENLRIFMEVATPYLKSLPEEVRIETALKMIQAETILMNLDIPLIASLDNFEKRYYTTLQVSYNPVEFLFWLSSILLMLGVMGMVYVTPARVFLLKSGDNVSIYGTSRKNQHKMSDLFTEIEKL